MRRPPPLAAFPRYPVTAGTILLAAGVTIAWATGRIDIDQLVMSPLIQNGQWWRLLSSALPHDGPLHLLFDVYWLWVLGTLVEEELGHAATFGVYCLLAAISGAIQYALSGPGIGLSGVGYGLVAMLWVLRRDPRFIGGVDKATMQLFAIWFVFCVGATMMKLLNIGNVAHGAGAVAGVLLGWAILRGDDARRMMAVGALVVLLAAGAWAATVGRPLVNMSADRGVEEAHLGYLALQAGDNDEALRLFQQAARMRPGDWKIWNNLSIAYERVGQPDKAAAAYDRSKRLGAPSDTSAD